MVTHTTPKFPPTLGKNKLYSHTRVDTLCESWFIPPVGGNRLLRPPVIIPSLQGFSWEPLLGKRGRELVGAQRRQISPARCFPSNSLVFANLRVLTPVQALLGSAVIKFCDFNRERVQSKIRLLSFAVIIFYIFFTLHSNVSESHPRW